MGDLRFILTLVYLLIEIKKYTVFNGQLEGLQYKLEQKGIAEVQDMKWKSEDIGTV